MNPKKFVFFSVSLILLITAIFISKYVVEKPPSVSSFDDLVLNHLNNEAITSIEVYSTVLGHSQEKAEIVNENKMNTIISELSNLKLKESSRLEVDEDETYRIRINSKEGKRFDLVFYGKDRKHIGVRNHTDEDKPENSSGTYEIVSEFNWDKFVSLSK
ncbi:hypothetical protein [Paenibacillus sanguinis]|uniref:hypothetical protein n=1 Tax=Paenibacillus sanguinis TaxID=225906 RepID=UPI000379C84E|nr:hypothetical protein [Paenibacillus sanguinis]